MFTLPYTVSLYVPSTVDHNVPNPMLHIDMTHHVAEAMSNMFGGATVSHVQGFYKADNGEIIQENIAVVRSNCTMTAYDMHKPNVTELAQFVCDVMRQECVGVDFNGTFSLIEPMQAIRQAA